MSGSLGIDPSPRDGPGQPHEHAVPDRAAEGCRDMLPTSTERDGRLDGGDRDARVEREEVAVRGPDEEVQAGGIRSDERGAADGEPEAPPEGIEKRIHDDGRDGSTGL